MCSSEELIKMLEELNVEQIIISPARKIIRVTLQGNIVVSVEPSMDLLRNMWKSGIPQLKDAIKVYVMKNGDIKIWKDNKWVVGDCSENGIIEAILSDNRMN
jgi:hypothetical protein